MRGLWKRTPASMEMNFQNLEDYSEKMNDRIEFEKHSSLFHILKEQEEFFLNGEGIIISSNLEAVNVTGYEEHEVLGKHIAIFYPQDEWDKAQADLKKAVNIGEAFVSGPRVKKRGVTFWAKMKIKSIQQTNPTIPCFKVILQDATHRAISNLRVRSIKDEYLAIFNNPFVGTFKFRMDNYRVQACNMRTLEIVGRQDSDDLCFDSFFNTPQQFEQFIGRLKYEKRLDDFKFLVNDSRRTEDVWAVISVRYFESRGFAEGVLIDISEQHNQMLELQRVKDELDNFTYHASHDFRAPLTTIMGLVNLGLRQDSLQEIQSYLELIKNRVGHLDLLLKDLTSVFYNQKAEVESENFDFKTEVKAIIDFLGASRQAVNLSIDIRQDCLFSTDPIRVRTILRNLLSNALTYVNTGVKRPEVRLKVQVNAYHATIQLTDNGIGIDRAHKEKVYDMFFRATSRSTGSGLGLYIAKSMVDKLKGTISFESTLHEGTTFLATLPNRGVRSMAVNFDHFNQDIR